MWALMVAHLASWQVSVTMALVVWIVKATDQVPSLPRERCLPYLFSTAHAFFGG